MKGNILIGIIFILLVGTVSASMSKTALQTDVKNSVVANYPKVQINDCGFLSLGCLIGDGTKTAELTLIDNTNVCGEECYAIKQINLYKDAPLIEDVRFYNIEKTSLINIKDFKVYIQIGTEKVEIEEYGWVCDEPIEKGGERSCSQKVIGYHEEERAIWKEYNGEEKTAGNYTVKIVGHKDKKASVDWQIKVQGEWITEWAGWFGDDAVIVDAQILTADSNTGVVGNSWDGFNWINTTLPTGLTLGTFKGVELQMQKQGSPTAGCISLWNVNATQVPNPAGMLVQNCTFLGSTGTLAWYNITMPPYTVLSGTNYSVIMNVTGDGSNRILWNTKASGAKPRLLSTDGGVSWVFDAEGTYWKVYVNTSSGSSGSVTNLYETQTTNLGTFINVSYTPLNPKININGTNYTGTLVTVGTSNYTINYSFTAPTFTTNANFPYYFTWENSSATINSTTFYYTISPIYFQICNATTSTTYINFTFEDESTLLANNGSIDTSTWTYWLGDGTITKTYLYTNLSTNGISYPFCFSPSDKTLNYNVELQYSYTGYPQRRYALDGGTLTNTTTQRTLLLLGSSSGIYSVYQVQTSSGGSISGVNVVAERQFSGVWTIVEEGVTDSAGAVTFWLNPNYDHRLTFTKAGYTSQQVILRPSSSTYTVVMATGTGTAYFNNSLEGFRWLIYPSNGQLQPNTVYNFNFTVNSSKSNLVACKMELYDNSTLLSSTTGCTSNGGIVSINLNTASRSRIIGKYYLDIGGGFFAVEQDAYWWLIPGNVSDYTIKNFLTHLGQIDDSFFGTGCGNFTDSVTGINIGEHACRAEYSRIVFIFFIIFLLFGMISVMTKWDFISTGGMLIILFPIVLFLSLMGWFRIDFATLPDWLDKYTVAIISAFITGGYVFGYLAKQ